jgi:hypothetical protein
VTAHNDASAVDPPDAETDTGATTPKRSVDAARSAAMVGREITIERPAPARVVQPAQATPVTANGRPGAARRATATGVLAAFTEDGPLDASR